MVKTLWPKVFALFQVNQLIWSNFFAVSTSPAQMKVQVGEKSKGKVVWAGE